VDRLGTNDVYKVVVALGFPGSSVPAHYSQLNISFTVGMNDVGKVVARDFRVCYVAKKVRERTKKNTCKFIHYSTLQYIVNAFLQRNLEE